MARNTHPKEQRTTPPNRHHHPTRQLRQHSRDLIRTLGLLEEHCLDVKLTPAQAHALIELEAEPINGVTLAERLSLNKSNASRVLKQLQTSALITLEAEPQDQRSQLAKLTATGVKKLKQLHAIYDDFADAALAQLTPKETESLLEALTSYTGAIKRAMGQTRFDIRPITTNDDQILSEIIQTVSEEHGLAGQGYGVSDPNLTTLSAHYQQPKHIYWVVTQQTHSRHGAPLAPTTTKQDLTQALTQALTQGPTQGPTQGSTHENVLGGAGVQALQGDASLAELSKMYLLPEARGCGLARRLACSAIRFAQDAGYNGIYLETTASLKAALRLYQSLGFKQLEHHRGNTGHQTGCEIAMLIEF